MGGDGGGRYEGWVDDESDSTCGPWLVLWIFDFSKLESLES